MKTVKIQLSSAQLSSAQLSSAQLSSAQPATLNVANALVYKGPHPSPLSIAVPQFLLISAE